MNKALLTEVPHRYFLDLAVVYYYKLECETFGNASILVKNEHLKFWKITKKAWSGGTPDLPELLPAELLSLGGAGRWNDRPQRRISSFRRLFRCMCWQTGKISSGRQRFCFRLSAEGSEKLETDYYILPSSIHECIMVPVLDGLTPEGLHEMVKEDQWRTRRTEEILGDPYISIPEAGACWRLPALKVA